MARVGLVGLLSKWNGKPAKKGTGFEQPLAAHQHWHIDVSYINLSGTFYYLCSILDGCSRYTVNWDLRESMTEAEIEIISDNGQQFIAKDFKEFIRASGMSHVSTSAYYPQSNGKIERWHKALKDIASGRESLCRRRTRGGWWRATWDTTTMSA
jgi:transposase InsO family protein